MNVIEGQGLPDFVMLDHVKVTEDGFMENLMQRFEKKQIYTYIGEQLVSMNPFCNMPDLYSAKNLANYRDKYLYEVQPHIYAVGDDTFRNLMQTKQDQCVIITGESGAGKTEASKIFMQYIAKVSSSGGDAESIKQKLLDSNPILEAFGNAKTVRNDNSSRFGKYMEIQFDGAGSPLGGRITQYLLEKSRVVTRAEGERSFHIFYMLLAQPGLTVRFDLSTEAEEWEYLAMSGCFKIPHQDDEKEFKIVDKALTTLGLTDEDKETVWSILAVILHLGNISFKKVDKGAVEGSEIKDEMPMKFAAKHLRVDVGMLEKALTQRTVTAGVTRRASAYTVFLTARQAEKTRDSFAKALYNSIFSMVTESVNRAILAKKGKVEVLIGVLDIYGFEIFENNSFEQFCINYCNEKLQQVFIKLVLRQEQEEYVREGIEWKEIDYFNNEGIVDLIEGKFGILRKLDEICMVGQPSTKELCEKFDTDFSKNEFYDSYAKSKGKVPKDQFRIKHYAGNVDYEIEEFAEKNRDTLFRELTQLCQSSKNPTVEAFFPKENPADKRRPTTAGDQFVKSVNALIAKLVACQPHYIRCIKSNENKASFQLNEERVRHQVRYLNLVETVRVRRAGFCNRQPYAHFMRRYKMVTPRIWPSFKGNLKEGTQIILDDLKIETDEYRKGHTKLFIRNATTLFRFEKARADHMPLVSTAIQRKYRAYCERITFDRLKGAIMAQKLVRGFLARRRVKKLKAIRAIQDTFRVYSACKKLEREDAAFKIQLSLRRHFAQKLVPRLQAVRTIQTFAREGFAVERFKREEAAFFVQQWFRFSRAHRVVREHSHALLIQKHFRAWNQARYAVSEKRRIERHRASRCIQTQLRGYLERKHFAETKEHLRKIREENVKRAKQSNAVLLQALWRHRTAVINKKKQKLAVIVQKLVRGFLARRFFRRIKAAHAIQMAMRRKWATTKFRTQHASLVVQTWFRQQQAKKTVALHEAARLLQTAWRHRNARVHYWRVLASTYLQRYYRHYIRHRYNNRVLALVSKDAMTKGHMNDTPKSGDNFGKALVNRFPDPSPAPLAESDVIEKRLQYLWWAHNKIQSLDKKTNSLMRQKVDALDIFRGRKKWDTSRHWSGDYMDVKDNPFREKFHETVTRLFQEGGDTHINFADAVIKVNRHGSSQIQVLVVTDHNIYKYKPKNYKMIKTGAPISAVEGVHFYSGNSNFVVIEMASPHRDYVLDLGTNGCERFSELATILFEMRQEQGKKIPVTFSDKVSFNNSRTDKEPGKTIQMVFEKHPPSKQPQVMQQSKFMLRKTDAVVYCNIDEEPFFWQ